RPPVAAGDQRDVAEQPPGLVDGGLGVADVARAGRDEHRLHPLGEQVVDQLDQVEDGDAVAAAHVHGLAHGLGAGGGGHAAGGGGGVDEGEGAGLAAGGGGPGRAG